VVFFDSDRNIGCCCASAEAKRGVYYRAQPGEVANFGELNIAAVIKMSLVYAKKTTATGDGSETAVSSLFNGRG